MGKKHRMPAENELFMEASAESIFEVLLDARAYPEWIVGCKEIREVEESWPAPGSRFHHRVGVGPLTVDDSTKLVSADPPHQLVLEAQVGPVGAAMVVFDISPEKNGSQVKITEQPVSGPAAALESPVQDNVLGFRNVETLRRLGDLVAKRNEAKSVT